MIPRAWDAAASTEAADVVLPRGARAGRQLAGWHLAELANEVYLDEMMSRLPRTGVKRWLIWQHLPFARRRGGPGLAGVREPRRPRPPTRPARRRPWRRTPHAEHA